MDIKSQFLQELDDIEEQKRKILSDRELLDKEAKDIYEKAKTLESKKTEAEKAVKEAGGIDEIAKIRQELSQSIDETKKGLIDIKVKTNDLIKWENRLVDIEQRQKKEKDELTARQLALDQEKKTYKETMRKEFLEAVKNQLPL